MGGKSRLNDEHHELVSTRHCQLAGSHEIVVTVMHGQSGITWTALSRLQYVIVRGRFAS